LSGSSYRPAITPDKNIGKVWFRREPLPVQNKASAFPRKCLPYKKWDRESTRKKTMASINQSVPAALDLRMLGPSIVNGRGSGESQSELREPAAEQIDACPLLRGIVVAALPALLMWAAIIELAARMF